MITCPENLGGRSAESVVEQAIAGGARAVQLRDKNADDAALLSQARALLTVTRRHRVPLIINDRVEVARKAGADGVHLGQADGSLEDARRALGEDAIIGRSTHDFLQAFAADQEGFDYIGVGPIYATPTKPGRPPVGLKFVQEVAQKLTVPFVAIGGIDIGNLSEVLGAGAEQVAVVRAVMAQTDPKTAAQQLINILTGKTEGGRP